jgi:hypothetical protein
MFVICCKSPVLLLPANTDLIYWWYIWNCILINISKYFNKILQKCDFCSSPEIKIQSADDMYKTY